MEGVPGDPGPKNDQKIFFFGKSVLFDQKKPEDRPGTGEKNRKKIEKFFDSTNGRPGPDRHRSGTGLARPVKPLQGPVKRSTLTGPSSKEASPPRGRTPA